MGSIFFHGRLQIFTRAFFTGLAYEVFVALFFLSFPCSEAFSGGT